MVIIDSDENEMCAINYYQIFSVGSLVVATDKPEKIESTYIWDVPTRLFHWGLMCAVATSLIAGEFGYMDIHVISGHVVLALIIFRLARGVFGGKHARFLDFIKGPKTVLTYVKRLIS